ncbi:hypothetical protein ACQEVZ_09200 [Dactylosporangium sp. CA-152071]|uniref:hypothetical protein n=1 Tax=Dactylosporangium sp. CA-152071 TaxID=3239933 RepID=UPI003D92824D
MEPTTGRRPTQKTAVNGGEAGWVPIAELTDLARALLGERPSGRDVVPMAVAERISRLAAQWASAGFTAATVRPWVDLQPAAAAVLAKAGATPEALDRQVVTVSGAAMTLWRAVCSGAMPAADAAAALRPAGGAPAPAAAPSAAPAPVGVEAPARAKIAPALFSHPATETVHDTAEQRRRSAPPATPFSA